MQIYMRYSQTHGSSLIVRVEMPDGSTSEAIEAEVNGIAEPHHSIVRGTRSTKSNNDIEFASFVNLNADGDFDDVEKPRQYNH